ncbi:Beta-galactosidase C-terminal domain, partial [Klebsiella pneumoniae]|uniref:Beta-galactosidase C-terminal domain n=3 Tax=Klebsiella/Raoultella group TaxID=2890311 RepID=UPI002441E4E0
PLVVKKMRNRAGKTIHFLFNYSGEAQEVISETAGTALLSGEAVDVGQPLRLEAWEFTIIES